MALFNDALIQEIATLVNRRYQELGAALGKRFGQETSHQLDEQSSLHHDLKLLIGVANGEYHRTDEVVHQVELALTRLLELLLGTVLSSSAAFPDGFWQTDTGILVARARWWVSVDDLITISNAAALAFGANTQANRMRVARASEPRYRSPHNGVVGWQSH